MPTAPRRAGRSCTLLSVDLVCVDPERVRHIWPWAKRLINAAITKTDLCSTKDIEHEVLAGRHLLWLAWDRSLEADSAIAAAATTRLTDTGNRKTCEIVACGGSDRDKWLPLLKQIEDYAMNEGCSSTRIIGRVGWERVLDGYRREYVILEKRLGRNEH